MTELNPCPFCGGEAERIDIEDGENAGGSCICCTVCQASGGIEFGRKENFVSNWNRRSTMKTKSPEFEMEITVALRHAASGMADRLQQTNAIDRAIAFISEARATGRREGMEEAVKIADDMPILQQVTEKHLRSNKPKDVAVAIRAAMGKKE